MALSLLASAASSQTAANVPSDLAADAEPDSPSLLLKIGSGAEGTTDGNPGQAQFVSPSGLSFAKNGDLFVADSLGQRVRKISKSGYVTTVAGSGQNIAGFGVPGGYLDGPVSEAKFQNPEGVLALADGDVLIADTGNHVIRLIHQGLVSTWAGDQKKPGNVDGPKSNAEFQSPVSLAEDAAGSIYVADPPNGLRKIARDGTVSSIGISGVERAVALAVTDHDLSKLLIGSPSNVTLYDLSQSKVLQQKNLGEDYSHCCAGEAGDPLGPVMSIAAFSPLDFVWADTYHSVIRYGQLFNSALFYSRSLGSVPSEAAQLGVLSDQEPSLLSPLAVALSPSQNLAVSDTGHHRILLFSHFNRETANSLSEQKLPTSARNSKSFSIALAGSSMTWYNQSWHESLAGMLNDAIGRRLSAKVERKPDVYPIQRSGLAPDSAISLASEYLSPVFDEVILIMPNWASQPDENARAQQYGLGWDDRLSKELVELDKSVVANGSKLLVVNVPGYSSFPGEAIYLKVRGEDDKFSYSLPDPSTSFKFSRQCMEAIRKSGVPFLDLSPEMAAFEDAPGHPALFASDDHHFAFAARKLIVNRIFERLVRDNHWSLR